jgi:hypothetical protein
MIKNAAVKIKTDEKLPDINSIFFIQEKTDKTSGYLWKDLEKNKNAIPKLINNKLIPRFTSFLFLLAFLREK